MNDQTESELALVIARASAGIEILRQASMHIYEQVRSFDETQMLLADAENVAMWEYDQAVRAYRKLKEEESCGRDVKISGSSSQTNLDGVPGRSSGTLDKEENKNSLEPRAPLDRNQSPSKPKRIIRRKTGSLSGKDLSASEGSSSKVSPIYRENKKRSKTRARR